MRVSPFKMTFFERGYFYAHELRPMFLAPGLPFLRWWTGDADEGSCRRAFRAMQLIYGVLLLCLEVTGAGMGQENVTTHRTPFLFFVEFSFFSSSALPLQVQ